ESGARLEVALGNELVSYRTLHGPPLFRLSAISTALTAARRKLSATAHIQNPSGWAGSAVRASTRMSLDPVTSTGDGGPSEIRLKRTPGAASASPNAASGAGSRV